VSVHSRLTLALAAVVIALCGAGCRARAASGSLQTNLDTLFRSPSGLYTLRYNHTWSQQQLVTEAGTLDLFTLPNATVAVEMETVPQGTKLEGLTEQMMAQYRSVNIQGLERAGSIDVGGGQGELLRAVTYVDAQGVTTASAPSAGAKPRTLYQAFYLVGNQRYTFSVAWPQGDNTDYVKLFRTILKTFALTGTT
jgi:hypothetical protein